MFWHEFECFCSSIHTTCSKDIFILKMAELTASDNPATTTAGKQKFKWKDELVEKLIDLYEERPRLWDISDRSYSKRDVKEKALSEIKEEMGIEVSIIQAKWKALRTQHG